MAKVKIEITRETFARGSLVLRKVPGDQPYRLAGPDVQKRYSTLYGARIGFEHHRARLHAAKQAAKQAA